MSVRKRFSPELFAENDLSARDAVKALLKGSEYNVVDNSKRTGVDLFLYKDGVSLLNIECEIKKYPWEPGKFKWDTVQLPERKKKYCLLDKPTIFVIFNIDRTAYVCFTSEEVLKAPLKEVRNRLVWAGEQFFQVPLKECSQDNLLIVIKSLLDE